MYHLLALDAILSTKFFVTRFLLGLVMISVQQCDSKLRQASPVLLSSLTIKRKKQTSIDHVHV